VLSLVAAGLGVSPVAVRAELFHSRPGIAFVPFRDAPPIEYGLLSPAAAQSPRVLAFVDMLRDIAGTATADGAAPAAP
jgi:DNA-binding transcriptional LysR family regulator